MGLIIYPLGPLEKGNFIDGLGPVKLGLFFKMGANDSKPTGYEPLEDEPKANQKLQLEAIKLGVNPCQKKGRQPKLNVSKKVKLAMHKNKMVSTYYNHTDKKWYFRQPISKKMLESQIKAIQKRKLRATVV